MNGAGHTEESPDRSWRKKNPHSGYCRHTIEGNHLLQPAASNPLPASVLWNLVANNCAETTMLVFEQFADGVYVNTVACPREMIVTISAAGMLPAAYITAKSIWQPPLR